MEKLKDISVKTVVNKIVPAILLILLLLLLHIVALYILCKIDIPLHKLIVQDPFEWSFKSGLSFSLGTFTMQVFEAFAVSLVGAVLIVRHGWWGKKLFIHTAVWYAVYLVVSLCIIYYEGKDWNILWSDYLKLFAIENSLSPLIVIALMAVPMGINRLFMGDKDRKESELIVEDNDKRD